MRGLYDLLIFFAHDVLVVAANHRPDKLKAMSYMTRCMSGVGVACLGNGPPVELCAPITCGGPGVVLIEVVRSQ